MSIVIHIAATVQYLRTIIMVSTKYQEEPRKVLPFLTTEIRKARNNANIVAILQECNDCFKESQIIDCDYVFQYKSMINDDCVK